MRLGCRQAERRLFRESGRRFWDTWVPKGPATIPDRIPVVRARDRRAAGVAGLQKAQAQRREALPVKHGGQVLERLPGFDTDDAGGVVGLRELVDQVDFVLAGPRRDLGRRAPFLPPILEISEPGKLRLRPTSAGCLNWRTNVYTLSSCGLNGIRRRPRRIYALTESSFAEAVTILEDDFALTREDPDAVEERRYVTLGLSNLGNLLVVVYTYREPDAIRVISAWKANRRQRVLYEEGRS